MTHLFHRMYRKKINIEHYRNALDAVCVFSWLPNWAALPQHVYWYVYIPAISAWKPTIPLSLTVIEQ